MTISLTRSRGPLSKEIVFVPELLTRITKAEAVALASNPRYFFQTKHDGDRLMIQVDGQKIGGINRSGEPCALDRQLQAVIRRICDEAQIDKLLLDGEWEPEGDGYHVWDMLECRQDLRSTPYADRLACLSLILDHPRFSDLAIVHLTSTAVTDLEKLELLANQTLEGVAVKDRRAPYRPGRNGQHKKYKHEQDASFIVGPKPRGYSGERRSVALYIIEASTGQERFVATVGVPDRYVIPADGAIIDVRYLYAYRGAGVAQPKYFGKVRTDVRRSECTSAQFRYKAE